MRLRKARCRRNYRAPRHAALQAGSQYADCQGLRSGGGEAKRCRNCSLPPTRGRIARMRRTCFTSTVSLSEYFAAATTKARWSCSNATTIAGGQRACFSIDHADNHRNRRRVFAGPLPNGHLEIGIHIAAPALFFTLIRRWRRWPKPACPRCISPATRSPCCRTPPCSSHTAASSDVPALPFYAEVDPSTHLISPRAAPLSAPIAANLRLHELKRMNAEHHPAKGEISGEFGTEPPRCTASPLCWAVCAARAMKRSSITTST